MRAAFYECDITPPLGCYLSGQGANLYAADVQDRLYAKAIVVEDEGRYAAIVCVDTISISKEDRRIVTDRIFEYTGIPRECVCLTSDHTHWGAPVREDAKDPTYYDVFCRLTADAVILAYKRLEDASATFGVGKVDDISFNRNHVLTSGRVMTWGQRRDDLAGYFGPIDPDVGVMTFYCDGKPIGAIVNFACHQATLPSAPDFAAYTGDFSSILSKELKKVYGEDFVSLFLLGACGDVNHIDPYRKTKYDGEHYRKMGERLAKEALKTMDEAKPVEGALAVRAEQISLPTRQLDEETFKTAMMEYANGYESALRLGGLLDYYRNPKPPVMEFLLQTIRIGTVCIYTVPGEIYAKFALDIKAKDKHQGCMVVEQCNGRAGYVPTPDCWAPNCDVYEASYSGCSFLAPEAGDMMVERLLEMAKTLEG